MEQRQTNRLNTPVETKGWAIRTRLQIASKTRDLALFNTAIDSKLRGCDTVRLRIEDIAPHGRCNDYAVVRQRKTGRPVKFELTEQTRQAVDRHLARLGPASNGNLFPGRKDLGSHLTADNMTGWFRSRFRKLGCIHHCMELILCGEPKRH